MYEHNAPSEDEVQEAFNEAMALEAEGTNPYPGSSYIGGVKAALAWVTGESDDPPVPMPDDE